jgi:calcium and integrin-binding protein 1
MILFYIVLDFDGDDMLGVGDLREVVERLSGGERRLSEAEMTHLVHTLLAEADLDDDGALSFAEFEHVIDNSPDFAR